MATAWSLRQACPDRLALSASNSASCGGVPYSVALDRSPGVPQRIVSADVGSRLGGFPRSNRSRHGGRTGPRPRKERGSRGSARGCGTRSVGQPPADDGDPDEKQDATADQEAGVIQELVGTRANMMEREEVMVDQSFDQIERSPAHEHAAG